MPPKKEVVQLLPSEDEFLKRYNGSNKKLIVLDLHPAWCGPCELMNPTYKQVSTLYDDFEKRLEFCTLAVDLLKTVTDKRFTTSCKPKFLFLLEGKVVNEVNGVNVPELLEKIQKHIPY